VTERLVVDASPLIVLAKANLLDLLKGAAETVHVPAMVAGEIRAHRVDEAVRALDHLEWLRVEPAPLLLGSAPARIRPAPDRRPIGPRPDADGPFRRQPMDEWEFREWLALLPVERLLESQRLWSTFLLLGGSCDLEPDSQSPFDLFRTWGESTPDGRTGLHSLRSGGVQS